MHPHDVGAAVGQKMRFVLYLLRSERNRGHYVKQGSNGNMHGADGNPAPPRKLTIKGMV